MTIITKPNQANFKSGQLENGLSLLTIQSNQQKAGVAMAVKAGNYQDPDEHIGLAHFLEHMLFLGTQSHPEEGFHAYIEQAGGKCNAWTSLEYSNFFYDVAPELLADSLERFSELFTCPLFAAKWIEKEINAIDSEFNLKINDDIRRLHEVHKETSNPNHPFSRFTTGNKETLNASSEALQQALFQFFKQHYVGENLCLVIVSPFDCESTYQKAQTLFANVSDTPAATPDYPKALYLPEQLGIQLNIHSHKIANRLILSFPVPSEEKQSLAKSLTYISCIFGHEGSGSLLSGLKKLNFATSLTAGGGVDNETTQDFNISIQLTQHGIDNLEAVCTEIFGYINFVKHQSYQPHIYQEKQLLSELADRYQDTIKSIDLASQTALKLHYYPPEKVFIADYAMTGMDPDWLEKTYQALSPDNLRLVVLNQQPEQENVSRYYKVPYSLKPLSADAKANWNRASCIEHYQLPVENPYLPAANMSVPPRPSYDDKPQKLINEKAATVWFKQDQRANAPHGHIYISLDLPNSQGNLKKIAMTRLFIELFMDDIAEENYPAIAAGLHYQISPHQAGMTIHISGYAEKQADFAEKLLKQLSLRRFTESNFNNIKQTTLTSWYNNSHIKPANQLFKQLTYMIQNNQYAYPDLADSISTLSFSEFAEFSVHLFERANLEAYIAGNWDITQALPLADNISKILFQRSKPCSEVTRRVYQLTESVELFHMLTPHQGVCVVNYFQATQISELSVAQFMLVTELLSPISFQFLRTEKQLGYMVGCAYFPINRCPGIVIYVQSNTHPVDNIQMAIEQMLSDLPEYLTQLEEDDWNHIKQALIYHLAAKQNNLATSAQNDWMSIGLKDTDFRRQTLICSRIEQISLDEIKAFVHQLVTESEQNRRLILTAAPESSEGLISDKPMDSLDIIKQFQASAQQIEL